MDTESAVEKDAKLSADQETNTLKEPGQKSEKSTKAIRNTGHFSVDGQVEVDIEAISRGANAPPKVNIKVVEKEFSTIQNIGAGIGVIAFCLMFVYLFGMIGVGIYYINECPVSRMLPIWLIVAGSLPLINFLINIIFHCKNRCKQKKLPRVLLIVHWILLTILGLWLIYGVVSVYSTHGKVEYNDSLISSNSNSSTETSNTNNLYCHKNVYIFFVITVPLYIVTFLIWLAVSITVRCMGGLDNDLVKEK